MDLTTASQAASGDEERLFAGLLGRALRGGSYAVEAELCEMDAAAKDAKVRRWAGQTLLNLLRIEGRFEALRDLRESCPGLRLSERALPKAVLALPQATISLPDEPAVLALLDNEMGLAIVMARVAGAGVSRQIAAVIDTGAGICIIDSDMAELLGVHLLVEETLGVIGSTGTRIAARPGVLDGLALECSRCCDRVLHNAFGRHRRAADRRLGYPAACRD